MCLAEEVNVIIIITTFYLNSVSMLILFLTFFSFFLISIFMVIENCYHVVVVVYE